MESQHNQDKARYWLYQDIATALDPRVGRQGSEPTRWRSAAHAARDMAVNYFDGPPPKATQEQETQWIQMQNLPLASRFLRALCNGGENEIQEFAIRFMAAPDKEAFLQNHCLSVWTSTQWKPPLPSRRDILIGGGRLATAVVATAAMGKSVSHLVRAAEIDVETAQKQHANQSMKPEDATPQDSDRDYCTHLVQSGAWAAVAGVGLRAYIKETQRDAMDMLPQLASELNAAMNIVFGESVRQLCGAHDLNIINRLEQREAYDQFMGGVRTEISDLMKSERVGDCDKPRLMALMCLHALDIWEGKDVTLFFLRHPSLSADRESVVKAALAASREFADALVGTKRQGRAWQPSERLGPLLCAICPEDCPDRKMQRLDWSKFGAILDLEKETFDHVVRQINNLCENLGPQAAAGQGR